MEHKFYKCLPSCGGCKFCMGGLQMCNVCKQAEVELQPECPGKPVDKKSTTSTLFRISGGFTHRAIHRKYEITPYTLVKEWTDHYVVVGGGEGVKKVNKRENNNLQWFTDLEEALQTLLRRIDTARGLINRTMENVLNHDARWNQLHIARFSHEQFVIDSYTVLKETKKAWYIDTGLPLTSKKGRQGDGKISGKKYIYFYQSQPHNPDSPHEYWISRDLDVIKKSVQLYGEVRLGYLHTVKQHLIDWVRLYEKEH